MCKSKQSSKRCRFIFHVHKFCHYKTAASSHADEPSSHVLSKSSYIHTSMHKKHLTPRCNLRNAHNGNPTKIPQAYDPHRGARSFPPALPQHSSAQGWKMGTIAAAVLAAAAVASSVSAASFLPDRPHIQMSEENFTVQTMKQYGTMPMRKPPQG